MTDKKHTECIADVTGYLERKVAPKTLEAAVKSDSKRNLEARRLLRLLGEDPEFIELMDPLVNPGSRSDRVKVSVLMDALLEYGRKRGLETSEPDSDQSPAWVRIFGNEVYA